MTAASRPYVEADFGLRMLAAEFAIASATCKTAKTSAQETEELFAALTTVANSAEDPWVKDHTQELRDLALAYHGNSEDREENRTRLSSLKAEFDAHLDPQWVRFYFFRALDYGKAAAASIAAEQELANVAFELGTMIH